jgi:hypothetical protein
MAADPPRRPARPGRAVPRDLAGCLRGRSGPELADLLDGLPNPVTVDLLAELAARGPAYARLPAIWPGHPDTQFLRRLASLASLGITSERGLAPPRGLRRREFGVSLGNWLT